MIILLSFYRYKDKITTLHYFIYIQAGIPQKLIRILFKGQNNKYEEKLEKMKVLHLILPFSLLLAGLALSLIVFVAEMFSSHKMCSKEFKPI